MPQLDSKLPSQCLSTSDGGDEGTEHQGKCRELDHDGVISS